MSATAAIVELLRVEYGLDPARGGMTAALASHLEDRIALLDVDEAALFERIRANVDDERARLVHAVTVRHSWFHRDPAQLDALAQLLCARHAQAPDRVLELWCAGCARGEEAWTLAMLAAELELPVRVLATDVDAVAVSQAKTGRYAQWSLRELPPALQRYFQVEGEGLDRRWVIDACLRDKVEFAVHNLCDPPPARRFDLICCRNVLIYFELGRARSVVSRLRERLLPAGDLVLGGGDLMVGDGALSLRTPPDQHGGAQPRRQWPTPAELAARAPDTVAVEPAPRARHEDGPLDRAGVAIQTEQYEQGLQLVAALIESEPLLVEAHFWAGLANYALGRYQPASEALRRARLLAPHMWPAILFAALTYERRGCWPAARRCWLELERSLALSEITPLDGTPTLLGALPSWRVEALELAHHRNSTDC